MYTVYALSSKIKPWIYVGMTSNLAKRFGQHNSGKVKSTKAFKPYELIFVKRFPTRVLAREAEKFYKQGRGKDKLKQLYAGVVELVDTSDSKSDAGYTV